nr:uncharacterized protein LOC131798310 isoform X4 [Pocillopora verrucosa]
MRTGASASRQQWTAADEDNTAVEDVRPRAAANANLLTNDMTGMTKLVEAKNKFLKIKSKEKNTACFQKQTDFSIKGELKISLEYEEPETLIVTIHKAFNIKAGNTLRNTSDAFVKCAISGTSFQYETKNPGFQGDMAGIFFSLK